MSSNKLRVLLISNDFLPSIGGVASHVHNLARELQLMGNDVFVMQHVYSHKIKQIMVEYKEYNIIRIERPKFPIRFFDIILQNIHSRKAIQIVGKPDVIHVHDYRSSGISALFLKRLTRKLIFTNHTSTFIENSKMLSQRIIDFLIFRGYDEIIAPSSELAQLSREVLNKFVYMIPNGVSIESYNYRSEEPDGIAFVIMVPRRMDPKNGIIYLARALHFLNKPLNYDYYKVIFLGTESASNVNKEYSEMVLKELDGIPDWIQFEFKGNVPQKDMPNLYFLAHLVVIPSLIEAISISALESMSVGVPVLASATGGLLELIETNKDGILVPPKDSISIAETISLLESDADFRSRIAVAGRMKVEQRYTWNIIATQTLNIYKKQY